jgi:ABC-type spermidine/putrescine transport system permease subunit I
VVPWWTSILVKNFAWVAILRDKGLVNNFLIWTGVIDRPVKMLYNEFAVIIGLVHVLIPFMALPLFATLDKIENSLIEAAENLGANPIKTFWEITLPLSMPGVFAGCILTFILSFGAFVTPALLGGAQNMMVANIIEDQFLQAFHWPFGSAIAIILLLIVLALIMIFNRLIGLEKIWGEKA